MSRSLSCLARPLLVGIFIAAIGGMLIVTPANADGKSSRRGGSSKSFSGSSSSRSSFGSRSSSSRSVGSSSRTQSRTPSLNRNFSSSRSSTFRPPSTRLQPSGRITTNKQPSIRKPSFTRPSEIKPGGNLGGGFKPPSTRLPSKTPSIRPGIVRPGTIKPGTRNPGIVRPGIVRPGIVRPGTIKPGTRNPGIVRPGTINPGVVRPGTVRPGADKPNTFNPGIIRPGTIKPGTLKPGVVRPNLGDSLRPGSLKPNLGDRKPGIKNTPRPIGKNGATLGGIKLGPGRLDPGKLNLRPNNLGDRLQGGDLGKLINSNSGKKFGFGKQFDLKLKGDAARQLGLGKKMLLGGGWRNRFCFGPIHNNFSNSHFGAWYCGPSYYPSWCFFPNWNPWVEWSWWDHCHSYCDPRPLWCQPILCDPCPVWVHCHYPVWEPLPVVACGTWIDVPLPVIPVADLDLQMLAVRFVDPGHPEKKLGPRYRVWVRNTSAVDIDQPFNVLLMAANSREPGVELPQQGVRIERIPAGEIQSVDIRLPFVANVMNLDSEGREVPFSQLHVMVDSHQEVPEAFEKNNGAILPRVDVLPVDPAVFSAEADAAQIGSIINLAGEGLGPEPGQVLVLVNGLELQAEILGWYDLGVRVQLPNLPLVGTADAEIVVIRGDTATANPLPLAMLPATPAAAAIAPAP